MNSQHLMKDKKLYSSSVLCKPRYNMHMVKQEKKKFNLVIESIFSAGHEEHKASMVNG